MNNIISLHDYRNSRQIVYIPWPKAEEAECSWSYTQVKASIEARFGKDLPEHFSKAMSSPQRQPYMYGDIHNVKYRSRSPHFNKPYPVPCEVTAESCRSVGKGKDKLYILGDGCTKGLDEPFPWMDCKYGVTLNFLKSLPNRSKLTIHTRSDLVACPAYVDELKRLRVHVTIWYCTVDEQWNRHNEPGAPSYERRKKAYEVLIDCGINAELRLLNNVVIKKAL